MEHITVPTVAASLLVPIALLHLCSRELARNVLASLGHRFMEFAQMLLPFYNYVFVPMWNGILDSVWVIMMCIVSLFECAIYVLLLALYPAVKILSWSAVDGYRVAWVIAGSMFFAMACFMHTSISSLPLTFKRNRIPSVSVHL